MIRSFNYTGRKRIPRRLITITVRRMPDGRRTFSADLQLEALNLSAGAPVFIEAYHRQSWRRFSCGTVGDLQAPALPDLSGLTGDRIRFRVKVLDPEAEHGLVIAEADQVSPELEDSSEQESLLPVEVSPNLGDQLWRVQFDEDEAVLLVSDSIPDVKGWIRSNPVFAALVFPAILREVLTYILVVENFPEEDEGHWSGLWLRFARALFSEPIPDVEATEQRRDWIEEAVGVFASRQQVRASFLKELTGEAA